VPTRRLVAVFLITIGLWIALTVARQTGAIGSGLRSQYFLTTDWTGPAAYAGIDDDISTHRILQGWRYTPPDRFSIRWSGYVFASRAGAYRFAVTSDDGSQLFVDGRLVVDNGGTHGVVRRENTVSLDRGAHAIVVQYFQGGGSYELEWEWASDGGSFTRVPRWLLSPRPRTYATLIWLRALSWIWLLLSIAWVSAGIVLARRSGIWSRGEVEIDADARGLSHGWPRRAVLCLVFFIALTIVQTWPLALAPGRWSRNDNADTVLNEWTLAWVAHQLPRNPLHLFDANIFFPERHTLAFSETLLVQSVMAAPLLYLGASPVLAYNLVLMAGFALTGWAMCLVAARWTGSWAGGMAAGTMMAFNAHTLTRLPHIQAQHVEFLPLALFMLDRVLRRPRWWSALTLGAVIALQGLASIYLLVFTAVALVVATLARPEDWLGARVRRVAPALVAAAALAALLLLPFLLPYWTLMNAGFSRSIEEAGYFAAGAENYLTTPSRFHDLSGVAPALFPGVVPTLLALVAILTGQAIADRRPRMCLAFGAAGVLLSLGPAVMPGFELLFDAFPLLKAIRTTSRFGYLGLVSLAVLGAYGVRDLTGRLRPGVLKTVAGGACVLAVALEPLAAPIPYAEYRGLSPIYRHPAAGTGSVVAELPLPPAGSVFRNAPYLLNSTLNWRPLINGYSGFTPPSYEQHVRDFEGFPARPSIDALKRAGVTHVYAHLDQFDAEQVRAIEESADLRLVDRDGAVALYLLNGR